jgi:hypothetical protein
LTRRIVTWRTAAARSCCWAGRRSSVRSSLIKAFPPTAHGRADFAERTCLGILRRRRFCDHRDGSEMLPVGVRIIRNFPIYHNPVSCDIASAYNRASVSNQATRGRSWHQIPYRRVSLMLAAHFAGTLAPTIESPMLMLGLQKRNRYGEARIDIEDEDFERSC